MINKSRRSVEIWTQWILKSMPYQAEMVILIYTPENKHVP